MEYIPCIPESEYRLDGANVAVYSVYSHSGLGSIDRTHPKMVAAVTELALAIMATIKGKSGPLLTGIPTKCY